MSDTTTKRMIAAYFQRGTILMFLSGFFESPAENFYSSEKIEIDIERSDEDIAIVVQDLSTGHRMNTDDLYTNKEFTAPIFKEAINLNSNDLLKRMPGDDPFMQVNVRANIITRMFKKMSKIERKIRRSIELQAAQILQTGSVTLTDENGVALYILDFLPKATHFPIAGIAWGSPGATIAADISALAEVIRNDGLADPDQLLMGIDAFEAFIKDDDIQKRYDNRRIDQGTIAPMQMRGSGGAFRGTVEIGNYKYDIWTYGNRYKDPQTGAKIQYLDPGKVVVRASSGRMDATFGFIPNIGRELGLTGTNLVPDLPSRISSEGGSMDLFTNAWISPDGETLFGGVGARPLLIPVAIDTYGCLDTGL